MISQVMIDLETLDTGPDSLILSIGAVVFNPAGLDGEILPILGREFYRPVSQMLQRERWGRTTSQTTIDWWTQQTAAAREAAFHSPDKVMLDKALLDLSFWLGGHGQEIWANPPTFDIVVLESAYRATSLTVPWGHRQPRCYRTLRSIAELRGNFPSDFVGTQHNALDDAKYQALNAARWLRQLGPVA